jgi:anti-sigma factor RsiW
MHDEYTMLMSLSLDGEATPDEQARLRAHLSACDVCAVTWEKWRAADRLLSAAPVAQAPADLLAGFSARLAVYEAKRRQARALGAAGFIFLWAVVVSAVVALFGSLVLGWLHEPALSGAVVAAAQQLFSGVAWTVRSVGTLARSVGWQPIALMFVVYMSVAGIMVLAWLWVLGRSRAWAPRTAGVR